jgi:hypothetical protein
MQEIETRKLDGVKEELLSHVSTLT